MTLSFRHAPPIAIASVVLILAACGPGEGPRTDDVVGAAADTDVWGGDAAPQPDAGDAVDRDASSDAPDLVDGTDTADGADVAPDERRPVTLRGEWEVGYREVDISYQARHDNSEDPRELNVSIWYPTSQREGEGGRYADLFQRPQVVEGAELADTGEMPLLVFSHGNGGMAEQSYFMTEFFATHGWTVVSPDHTGNTFRSGTAINYEAAIYRPQDIVAVLDRFAEPPADSPLEGRIDDERIAMAGHSFGGYTTLANTGAEYAVDEFVQLCQNDQDDPVDPYCDALLEEGRPEMLREGFHDPRIDLAIPQAPAGGLTFRGGLEQLQVPVMLMTGERDQTLPNERQGDRIWQEMKGPEHRRLNFPNAGHFTFSNMCDLFGEFERVQDDGCGESFIAPEKAFAIVNAYSLAFARYHFYGSDRAEEIIDGDRFPEGDEEIELSVGAE